jgi:pimeloyl-ACP methyl ester carboxylesterase
MSAVSPQTLVLLPGMDGTGMLFAPLLRALPEQIRPLVVAYPPDQPLDYAGHLELVMAALPTDRPFVLLGESFSGPLALMAAARRPAGLCGVILCATFVTYPLVLPRILIETALSLGLFHFKPLRFVQRMLLGSDEDNDISRLLSSALAQLTSQVLAARAKAICRVDCREELRQCPAPIHAMVAEEDRIIPSRQTGLFRSIRPDMQVHRFASPHLILQCAPNETANRIRQIMGAL